MLSMTFIVVFIFCLAIAVACILIGHQFITTYNTEFHRNYFYYLTTFFAFAIYGIWGQVLVRVLLDAMNTRVEVIEATASFLPVLGVPFLFISWIMLIKMAYSLFEVKIKNVWVLLHFVSLTILIFCAWGSYTYFDSDEQLFDDELRYFEVSILVLIELIYFLVFIAVASRYLKKQQKLLHKNIIWFLFLMTAGFVLRACLLPLAFIDPWVLAPVILLYFASNFPALFYLKINAEMMFKPVSSDNTNEEKMMTVFRRFRISKREKEIVMHICDGKTNQQIADELFISLQTVKDHTHRIYSKIGINSRMQLVQLMNN